MNIYLYGHGGSRNHGCEGIVRSTAKILSDFNIKLLSLKPNEDIRYGLDQAVEIMDGMPKVDQTLGLLLSRAYNKIFRNAKYIFHHMYRGYFKDHGRSLYFSIGGDNYCYGSSDWLKHLNKSANDKKHQTVLWGCSIEPDALDDTAMIEDLHRYALIVVRETLTLDALRKVGVTQNVRLYPDPAFVLPKEEVDLPKGFVEGDTVGINVSPLISKFASRQGVVIESFHALIQHIMETTSMHVALIPHVTKDTTDDREPLAKLYNAFKDTDRVVMTEDQGAMELKGIIARCRIFIGARTHSTIAAYSSCVPTLVVGYSIKAKGIAKDIFGTYDNYVKPVQSLEDSNDLIQAFQWISDHEEGIRAHLEDVIPSYIQRAWRAGDAIRELVEANCRD